MAQRHTGRTLLLASDPSLLESMPSLLSHSSVDIVSERDEAMLRLEVQLYDIVVTGPSDLDLVAIFQKQAPDCKLVLVTNETAAEYLPRLSSCSMLNNIVTYRGKSRGLCEKEITTTLAALSRGTGIEAKNYLGAKPQLRTQAIACNSDRSKLLDELAEFCAGVGVGQSVVRNALLIADELLMNCIFGAPHDQQGAALHNCKSRRTEIILSPEQQGCFQYGFDGDFLVISVSDPFGALTRQTVLDYLTSCYADQAGSLQGADKAGAGLGLYQVLESCAVLAISSIPGKRTEVVSVLAVDQGARAKGSNRGGSLHFFQPHS